MPAQPDLQQRGPAITAKNTRQQAIKRWDPGFVLLTLALVLLLPLFFRPFIHGADTVGYYAWLHSVVINHTLDVKDEFHHYALEFGQETREADINRKTPTGYTHNQYAAGSAIMWSPLYLAAHGAVLCARALGVNVPADGYSWPYTLAASLASTLYGFGAVWLTFRMARQLFGEFTAGIAAAVVWLATPTVFYIYSHPLMSQANDAFVTALFVYTWWRTSNHDSPRAGWARGLVTGLALWVRTQNAILLVILGLESLADLTAAVRQKRPWRPVFVRGLTTLTGFLVLFVPLMLFWRVVYGAWMLNTYAATQGAAAFDWRTPHALQVLFSSDRGLFIWAPATLPALIGLWWLSKTNMRLAVILLGIFVAQLYVVGSWFTWSGGVAFGPRFWVGLTILFGLGLAAFINAFRVPRVAWIAAASMFIIWNFLLIAQYSLETIPRSGPVDVGLMVRNQFTVIPERLPRILQALRNRR